MGDIRCCLTFTFEQGAWPVGELEVWFAIGAFDLNYWQVGTLASDAGTYRHNEAIGGAGQMNYKLRYRYGEVVGPWSNEFAVVVTEPPGG